MILDEMLDQMLEAERDGHGPIRRFPPEPATMARLSIEAVTESIRDAYRGISGRPLLERLDVLVERHEGEEAFWVLTISAGRDCWREMVFERNFSYRDLWDAQLESLVRLIALGLVERHRMQNK